MRRSWLTTLYILLVLLCGEMFSAFTIGGVPTVVPRSHSVTVVHVDVRDSLSGLGQWAQRFTLWTTTVEANAQLAAEQAAQALATQKAAQAAVAVTRTSTAAPIPVVNGDGYSVAQWQLVSQCENAGSWVPQGPAFPDGIGLTAANWAQFGGGADTSPDTTAAVGNRFLAAYGISIPDQNGCTPGGY